MFKLKDLVVCEYCQEQYSNKLELEAHVYFHTAEEDIEKLVSSLNNHDSSYMLPKALKSLPNGQMSSSLLELKKEEMLNPNSPMSKRIKALVRLCNKHPLTESDDETEENNDFFYEPVNEYTSKVAPMAPTSGDSQKSDSRCLNSLLKKQKVRL